MEVKGDLVKAVGAWGLRLERAPPVGVRRLRIGAVTVELARVFKLVGEARERPEAEGRARCFSWRRCACGAEAFVLRVIAREQKRHWVYVCERDVTEGSTVLEREAVDGVVSRETMGGVFRES